MATDMVVALGPATVNRRTLFALHHTSREDGPPCLRRIQGRLHAPGESVTSGEWRIPQARQTWTTLGCGPASAWGYSCGVNERHVAIGACAWPGKLQGESSGLSGSDLVRLGLERGHSARHALDTLTDLIGRYGLAAGEAARESGAAFLIADAHSAMALEATGHHWAMTSACQTRAAGDLALIRQDWERLSPGLSEFALQCGWWHEGGCKLDFAGSLSAPDPQHAKSLKSWGRATLLLEQQNGAIDHEVLRRLLAEHDEATSAFMSPSARDEVNGTRKAMTFLAELAADAVIGPVAWYANGAPRQAPFFPILIAGELPAHIPTCAGADSEEHSAHVEAMQERWDDAVEVFSAHMGTCNLDRASLERQATQLMDQLAADLSSKTEPFRNPRHLASTERAAEFAYVSE